jgi:hypothetical protein
MASPNFSPEKDLSPNSKNPARVCGAEAECFVFNAGPHFKGFPSSSSSRFFRITSSFTAKSSNPSEMSFPIRTDIPLSSWRCGKFTPGSFDACNARRQAKEILAHSAVDLFPEEVKEDKDEDLLSPVETLGEVDILLRDLGCIGDCGTELDRRSDFWKEDLTSSLADSFFRKGAGALIASLRALSAELMTSVASIDRSFGDNLSPSPCASPSLSAAVVARGFAWLVVLFDLPPTGALEAFPEMERASDFEPLTFGSRRSLSCFTVAGEQVDVEVTASRMKSAVA